jgi:hypothetical protein
LKIKLLIFEKIFFDLFFKIFRNKKFIEACSIII